MTVQFGPIELEADDWFEGWSRTSGANSTATEVLTGTPTAKATTETPPTISGDVVTRKQYGAIRAFELEQLLGSTSVQPIAVTTPAPGDDAYYVTDGPGTREDESSRGTDGSMRLGVSLVQVGTHASHYRAIETNPYQVDHEFGNDLTAEIAIPTAARKVQWYDAESHDRESATATTTVATADADVAIYDLSDAPWYDPPPFDEDEPPTLLYELPYADDADGACRVYDSRDREQFDDGRLQWQRVFSTHHDFAGETVLSNGRLRLTIDEHGGTLEAEEWDPTAAAPGTNLGTYGSGIYGAGEYAGADGQWIEISLSQPADTDLYDVDVTRIGMVRDVVQLTFDVDGSLFALNLILAAGHDAVLVDLPDGQQGPIPESLEEWLSPIASESIVDAGARKTLVSRNDVQR